MAALHQPIKTVLVTSSWDREMSDVPVINLKILMIDMVAVLHGTFLSAEN